MSHLFVDESRLTSDVKNRGCENLEDDNAEGIPSDEKLFLAASIGQSNNRNGGHRRGSDGGDDMDLRNIGEGRTFYVEDIINRQYENVKHITSQDFRKPYSPRRSMFYSGQSFRR